MTAAAELMQIAGHVANIAAKHEGGDVEIEQTLAQHSREYSRLLPRIRRKSSKSGDG